MVIRAPEPDDAPDIARIAFANELPLRWSWPEGKHGLVAEAWERVVAFAILHETVWGLVVDELWEEPTRAGYRGLAALSAHIEGVAQGFADARGETMTLGGIVPSHKARHEAALRKRGYAQEAVVLVRRFLPQTAADGIGEVNG
jgi:hypothetical protein